MLVRQRFQVQALSRSISDSCPSWSSGNRSTLREHDSSCEGSLLTVGPREVRFDSRRLGGPDAPERPPTAAV